jgi:transcriptional regulator with PAS, ATPase and Fis domain
MNRSHDPAQIVGKSAAMQAILALVDRVAPTRSSVLLTGESGTGKELIARALHRGGDDDRFLAINCAAIPHDLLENQLFGHRKGAFTGADRDQAGMFVHARGGTIFLDEIGDIAVSTQAKLLRAIDQREVLPIGANEPILVDARVLAATNKDLEEEVKAGRFREDLFYRLNVINIRMPPLRDRREDIPDLVEFLVAKHAGILAKAVHGVTYEALSILLACKWKGNVRELENVLQRAIILGDGPLITPADLPADLVPENNDYALVDDLAEASRRFERQHIERMLRRFPDKKEAARRLGVGLSSLYRKISELGIAVPAEVEAAPLPQPGAV